MSCGHILNSVATIPYFTIKKGERTMVHTELDLRER